MTPAQCRAARGLLGWTLDDLSSACGLSRTSLANFEIGNGNLKHHSTQSILIGFGSAGIEFTFDGVRFQQIKSNVYFWGEETFGNLIADILATPLSSHNEIRLCDPYLEMMYQFEKYDVAELRWRVKQTGLTMRVLTTTAGHKGKSIAVPHSTRCTAPSVLASTFMGYGNKVAFVNFNPHPVTSIVESDNIAGTHQRIFDCLWEAFTEPTL